MVDLAKIRKKAKDKDKSSSRRVDESSSVPDPAAPAPDPATTRRLDDSTTQPRPEETAPKAAGNQPPATNAPIDKLERFKSEAGKRRDAIKASDVIEAQEARLELLTFLVSGEQYAIEIERIVEIVPPRPVTRIPNADPSVVGIVSLRGTIVTLVDVRRKLGHPAGADSADTRIVVIDFHNETIGFAVDRVLRVVKLVAAEVEPHPVVHAAELEAAVRGVFRVSGALTILLDLDKLLDAQTIH